MQITPDNEYYLDRHKVTFERETTVLSNDIPINPMAGARRYVSKSVPVGTTSSEYTGSDYTFNSTGKVDFGVTIVNIAIGTLITYISGGFAAFWGYWNGGIGTAAFNIAASWLKASHPYTRYASFKDVRNSRLKDNAVYYYKHSVYLYGETKLRGKQKAD